MTLYKGTQCIAGYQSVITSASTDNKTISLNSSDELQAIGVIDTNASRSSTRNFTVVGSPTITDDGIASGFSSSNYLISSHTIPLSSANSFEISCYNTATSQTSVPYEIKDNANHQLLRIQGNLTQQSLVLNYIGSSASSQQVITVSGLSLQANTMYKFVVGFTGTSYYIKIYDANNNLLGQDSINNTNKIYYDGYTRIGYSFSTIVNYGTIDLKAFSITVDGEEVYRAWTPELKYWTGTSAQYNAITTKSSTTLYNVQNQGLYLGSTRISANYTPPLLSNIWADHTLNDLSWVNSSTFSWQNGTTYSTAYNHLVTDISGITAETETIGSYTVTFYRATDGHKICLADQETTVNNIYNESGIAWYYILDTTNTRFKLPRTKRGFEGLRDNVGDYVAESLPNITADDFRVVASTSGISPTGAMSGVAENVTSSSSGYSLYESDFDASRSSSTYQNNAPVQERSTQMYLYFYVGEYSQTAIEQTAGLNSELFNGKLDITSAQAQAPYLKTSYVSGTSGYNIWSNGYCEQWGRVTATTSGEKTITFTKTFKDTNYIAFKNLGINSSATAPARELCCYAFTTTSLKTYINTDHTYSCWKACGYLAEGEY